MSRNELIAALRQALTEHNGVRLVLLFGSMARDTANATSDVDLAVDAEPQVDLVGLASALSLTLGHEVDIVQLRHAGVPLLEELLRDGIVVHEGSARAGARWRSHAIVDLETDRPWYARMRDAWLKRVAERGLGNGQS